ncbi:sulfur carrier protein ThiS [Nocardioides sp. DS6]|uniref:Sulfur carrier protein ThiS n=1 Tax=Nocardioides eburneus TaxID=3231482 RepID=A0ABV3SXK9_9ACTN
MGVLRITVNGEPREVTASARLADLVPECRGSAAAVNGAVVPRDRHAATPLHDGDAVEIVTAVQGG